jgi:hypothetical protein
MCFGAYVAVGPVDFALFHIASSFVLLGSIWFRWQKVSCKASTNNEYKVGRECYENANNVGTRATDFVDHLLVRVLVFEPWTLD